MDFLATTMPAATPRVIVGRPRDLELMGRVNGIATTADSYVVVGAGVGAPIADRRLLDDNGVLELGAHCPRVLLRPVPATLPLAVTERPVILRLVPADRLAPATDDLVARRAVGGAPVIDTFHIYEMELRRECWHWRCATLVARRRSARRVVAGSHIPRHVPKIAALTDRKAVRRYTAVRIVRFADRDVARAPNGASGNR